jgi:hypothetical protein
LAIKNAAPKLRPVIDFKTGLELGVFDFNIILF